MNVSVEFILSKREIEMIDKAQHCRIILPTFLESTDLHLTFRGDADEVYLELVQTIGSEAQQVLFFNIQREEITKCNQTGVSGNAIKFSRHSLNEEEGEEETE